MQQAFEQHHQIGFLAARALLAQGLGRIMARGYLQAAMAVCALTASADGEVGLEERYAIDAAIAHDPLLACFAPAQAVAVLDDQLFRLRAEPAETRETLLGIVEKAGRRPERAVALMRLVWNVIAADDRVRPAELAEFETLCDLLEIDVETLRAPMLGL